MCGQFVNSQGPPRLSYLVTGVGCLDDADHRIIAALLGPEHLLKVGVFVIDQGQALAVKAIVAQPLGVVNLLLQKG